VWLLAGRQAPGGYARSASRSDHTPSPWLPVGDAASRPQLPVAAAPTCILPVLPWLAGGHACWPAGAVGGRCRRLCAASALPLR
jgi:hypothetical protein